MILLIWEAESEHCLAQDDSVLHISAEDPSKRLNKTQLKQWTQQIAYCLRSKYGIGVYGPGKDIVTVLSHGQPIAPAVFFGVIAAGGVYSAASSSLTADELTHQVRLAQPQLIICSSEVIEIACKAAKACSVPHKNVLILGSEPSWSLATVSDGLNLLTDQRLRWEAITDQHQLEQSLITVIWSSGTTGVPKGVMLSHANLVSQVFITHFQGRENAGQQVEKGTFEPFEFRTLAHLPASHISGLFGYFVSPFYGGGTVIWMRKYRWDKFLLYFQKYQITYLFTVPSIYLRIAKSADVRDQFLQLKSASTGSAPMSAELQSTASTRLGISKEASIAPTWGLSETTGAVTMTPDYVNDEAGSLGPVLPCLELRYVLKTCGDLLLNTHADETPVSLMTLSTT